MNKKIISLAALVAAAAGVNSAQAVNINADGLGQALVFPYYSAAAGNDTYINLVNTTNEVKAVKVRFLEGMNSQEVLDFNLYLSPYDHWSAVITPTATGAKVKTADTSCTVPALPADGQPFVNANYDADSIDGLERSREGYVEVIEMGTVSDIAPTNLATAATHVNNVPNDCGALTTAWSGGGVWVVNKTFGIGNNTGGLYGYGVLIDVDSGIAAGYDAIALDAWKSAGSQHEAPGDSLPTLGQADPVAIIVDSGTATTLNYLDGWDAVSATFMHNTISNDYVLDTSIKAGTDWVITFPTKNFYVNGAAPILRPFANEWDATKSEACEEILITYYDREENGESPTGVQFSPKKDGDKNNLCKEANILSFLNESGTWGGRNVLGAVVAGGVGAELVMPAAFEHGWAVIDFANGISGIVPGPRVLTGADGNLNPVALHGLPVTGFAVQQYVNDLLVVDGQTVLSNYMGAVQHKATRQMARP